MISVIILARPNSSRLPDKHNRIIGDRTLMDWVIERARSVTDTVVISTTPNGVKSYLKYSVPILFSDSIDEDNVCGRIRYAAESWPVNQSDIIVTILGDCPLADPNLILKLVSQLAQSDCDYATGVGGFHSHAGIEVIRRSAINRIPDGEHLSIGLQSLTKLEVPLGFEPVRFRSSVDNFADLAFMRECYQVLSLKGRDFNYENVLFLLSTENVTLMCINAHVNQKSVTFNTDKPNIALITKGDECIGIGHIARAIAIAQRFNEIGHRHIHFFVNDHPLVNAMLTRYGYIKDLDYSYDLPTIKTMDFKSWEFIHDYPEHTTYDYDVEYRNDPTFAVNYRLNYTIPIKCNVVVSFGQGDYAKYGKQIFEQLTTNDSHLFKCEPNLVRYLKGANRIITIWSQTARECIALGKIPEVYSTNLKDDELCKYLDKKGVLKWQGNLFKQMMT